MKNHSTKLELYDIHFEVIAGKDNEFLYTGRMKAKCGEYTFAHMNCQLNEEGKSQFECKYVDSRFSLCKITLYRDPTRIPRVSGDFAEDYLRENMQRYIDVCRGVLERVLAVEKLGERNVKRNGALG